MGASDGGRVPGRADGTDLVFAALADPNRRHLLERLSAEGPQSATDLAGDMSISRQAVVKHLSALVAAGMLRPDRQGREVLFEVEPDRLRVATDWLERVGKIWDRRLVDLVKQLSPDEG